jgi:hypothetical protein
MEEASLAAVVWRSEVREADNLAIACLHCTARRRPLINDKEPSSARRVGFPFAHDSQASLLLCPEIPHSLSSLDSFDKPPHWSDQSTMIYPQPRHVATWLAVVASSALPMLADAQEMSDVTKCVPPPPTTQPNIRVPQRENSNRVH